MSPLKVGIIGYGKVGKIRHDCVRSDQRLTLIGICDSVSPLDVPKDVAYFSDYRQLLALKPDIVFICTYNRYIPTIAIDAIRRGIHVFTEKPPGCSLQDVESIYAAIKDMPQVKVKFGFNHRYHEAITDAKAIVDSGRLGEIMWLRGVYGKAGGRHYDKNWRNDPQLSGGGILIDQGIHMLDLFRFFAGNFDEVKSMLGRSYWTSVAVEDNAFVLLRQLATSKIAMLHSSATQWRHKFLLEIYMTRGYLEIDGILSSTRSYGRETLKVARCANEDGYPLPNPQENMSYYEEDRSWFNEINEFVEHIHLNKPIVCGGIEDAYQTMKLVGDIYSNDAEAIVEVEKKGKI
jgi:predicted dehydrogenase